jgi:hypothetical protein
MACATSQHPPAFSSSPCRTSPSRPPSPP